MIEAVQYDNGIELVSGEFNEFCESKGSRQQLSLPYCPEQYGLAERQNGILKTKELCLEDSSWPSSQVLAVRYTAGRYSKECIHYIRIT